VGDGDLCTAVFSNQSIWMEMKDAYFHRVRVVEGEIQPGCSGRCTMVLVTLGFKNITRAPIANGNRQCRVQRHDGRDWRLDRLSNQEIVSNLLA
jgi:hypothetical protein